MLERLISSALKHRSTTLWAASLVVGVSAWRLLHLPLDVWPDVSPVEVQILTPAPDLTAEGVEAAITRPLEFECAGQPGLLEMRSVSTFGLSQVLLIFQDGTDRFRARQIAQERLQNALPRLPRGYLPRLGPPSDFLGEVVTYAVRYRSGSMTEKATERLTRLKTLEDFAVRPQLLAVPGVVEVNATGGFDRQMVIEPEPRKLFDAGMDVKDLAAAVEQNVAIGGGAMLQGGAEQTVVRSAARAQTAEDLARSSVKLSWGSVAINVGDLARVAPGEKVRFGAASLNGEEAVLGTVMMLSGENATVVAQRVKAKLRQVAQQLPPEVEIVTLYNRALLTRDVLRTVAHNLAWAALKVMLVLALLFRRLKAAVVTAAVIPLAFIIGLAASNAAGVSANLMSLGALDFGLVVDAAVVAVDAYLLRLDQATWTGPEGLTFSERVRLAARSTGEVAPPMLFGWLVILLAYLPGFCLEGVDRKIFQPMTCTVACTLLAALPLSLTVIPILAALAIRRPDVQSNRRSAALAFYLRSLHFLARHRLACLSGAALLFADGLLLAAGLGFDLLPALDEGSTVLEVEKPVATSLEASLHTELSVEKFILEKFPEVKTAYSRLGFSDVATDPQAPSQNDVYLFYRPHAQWPLRDGKRLTKPELETRLADAVRQAYPDQELGLNQPVRVRLDEMLEGTHSDLTVEAYGPDLNALQTSAEDLKRVLSGIPGTGDVLSEPVGMIPHLTFQPNREAMSRYLVKGSEVDESLAAGFMGREVGRVDEPESFFPIVVRFPDAVRTNPKLLPNLPVRSAEGSLMLTLGQLGQFKAETLTSRVLHKDLQRRRAVMVNVRGRDLGGYAHDAISRLQGGAIHLPPGVRIEVGGHYRLLAAALGRLAWVIPVLLAAGFALVAAGLKSWRYAALVFSAVPFAVVGGVAALAARGLTLSVSALLGLTAVGGIALLNKLVFMHAYRRYRAQGRTVWPAIIEATQDRVRPVIATALVASAGFLPMALSSGIGAEVQRPIAWVIMGGLLTSSTVTLFLLPLLLLVTESAASSREVRADLESRHPAQG